MTHIERLVQKIQAQIKSGHLKTGDRLPSIRRAAEENNTSKNTVIEAYERLASKGLVQSKAGSGFYVNPQKMTEAPPLRPNFEAARDAVSLLRAQLNNNFDLRIGDGRPPSHWMNDKNFHKHLKYQTSDSEEQFGYGSALGFSRLREKISSLHQSQGINANASQVLMTFGANHALDLIIRYFLQPGSTVLVDNPGYYPLFAKLKLAGIKMAGVTRNANGPDPAEFEKKIKEHKPVIFFTQSRAQNPTGSSLDLPTAYEILRLADKHNALIVDDDPFLHLPGVEGISLATLDQFRNTISIGTFSKTLSASLRSGYIMANEEIIAQLAELKMITSVNSSRYTEMLIHRYMEHGDYQRHLKRLSKRIIEAQNALLASINTAGLSLFCPPTGGYYTFLNLPQDMHDLDIAKKGAANSIFIAPGTLFSPNSEVAVNGFRINTTRADDFRFFRFLSSLTR